MVFWVPARTMLVFNIKQQERESHQTQGIELTLEQARERLQQLQQTQQVLSTQKQEYLIF